MSPLAKLALGSVTFFTGISKTSAIISGAKSFKDLKESFFPSKSFILDTTVSVYFLRKLSFSIRLTGLISFASALFLSMPSRPPICPRNACAADGAPYENLAAPGNVCIVPSQPGCLEIYGISFPHHVCR